MSDINANIDKLINENALVGLGSSVAGSMVITAAISGLQAIYNHITSVDRLKKQIYDLQNKLRLEQDTNKKLNIKTKLDILQSKLKSKVDLLKFKHEELINTVRTKESNLKMLQQKSKKSTEDNQKITALQNEIRDSRVVLAKLGIYK